LPAAPGGLAQGKEVFPIPGLTGENCQVVFSPDGSLLAVASGIEIGKPGCLHVFAAEDGRLLRSFPATRKGVLVVAVSPDGRKLAWTSGGTSESIDKSGAVHVWDINSGEDPRRLQEYNCSFYSLRFSPDGKFLVAGGVKLVQLWDAQTFQEVRRLRIH